MSGSSASPSPQLLAANQRLYALRSQLREASDCPLPWDAAAVEKQAEAKEKEQQASEIAIAALPRHLGWGSARLTAVIRARVTQPARELASLKSPILQEKPAKKGETAELNLNPNGGVKVYPDIALALLQKEQTAPGRLWLLCRYLDSVGSGKLRVVNLRKILTHKKSDFYTFGWRQLRNLLREGNGIFWHRDKEMVWLRSAAKVAASLEVSQLTGQPVAVPVQALRQGIGTVRAHLYGSFHSGRHQADQQKPIARDTLAQLSGVGRRTQLSYEQQAGIEAQPNYAVGDLLTAETQEKQAWRHGQATFELYDTNGEQGQRGRRYIAWQLPNSYRGHHERRPRGRQKRINQELARLVIKGTPGNDKHLIEKRYFADGKSAVKKASKQQSEQPLYWWRHAGRNGSCGLWQALEH